MLKLKRLISINISFKFVFITNCPIWNKIIKREKPCIWDIKIKSLIFTLYKNIKIINEITNIILFNK